MNQPRCPSKDEWVKKLWYIYTMQYYSAIKRNLFELVLMRWMNLELITQSEVSQREKQVSYINAYIHNPFLLPPPIPLTCPPQPQSLPRVPCFIRVPSLDPSWLRLTGHCPCTVLSLKSDRPSGIWRHWWPNHEQGSWPVVYKLSQSQDVGLPLKGMPSCDLGVMPRLLRQLLGGHLSGRAQGWATKTLEPAD